MVDGASNDPAWLEAQETEVRFGKSGDLRLSLKCAVHEGSLYLLVAWPDPAETPREVQAGTGPPYLFRERGMRDAVIVNFPLSGPFAVDGDVPPDTTVDFWRWSPGEGAQTDLVEDGVLSLRGWGTVREGWYPGLLLMGRLAPDPNGGDRNGGDVLAQGRWKDGAWTVEFARALSTGHADDRDLDGLAEIPMRVVVSDRGDAGAFGPHGFSDTPVLRLLLPPPLPEDHQGPFPEPRGGPPSRR